MKVPCMLNLGILLVSFNAALTAAALAGSADVPEPVWAGFHSELAHRVALEVQAAKDDAAKIKKPVFEEPELQSRIKPDKFGPVAGNLVGGPTALQLDSALRLPISEEKKLRSIFREEGVPEELIYVGLVESGYSRDAVSSAGAVGPWQFIHETGRRYGLKQGRQGDDRRNLLKSTRAAARYLRDLHALLGDWTLALAGYNAGENRVLRAMQKTGAKDFWGLRYLLPRETAEYVPRVLAAISMSEKARPDTTE